MKKFSFRLEKLLKLRKNTEREKIRILATDLGKLSQAKKNLENLQEELDLNWEDLNKIGKKKIGRSKVKDFTNFYNYNDFLAESSKHQMHKIASIDRRLKKDRNQLQKAINKRKILEKLKEKKRNKYTKKYKCLIKKNEDEISLKAYSSSQRRAMGTTS